MSVDHVNARIGRAIGKPSSSRNTVSTRATGKSYLYEATRERQIQDQDNFRFFQCVDELRYFLFVQKIEDKDQQQMVLNRTCERAVGSGLDGFHSHVHPVGCDR